MVINNFISWTHFLNKYNYEDRGKFYARDILDYSSLRRKSKIQNSFGSMAGGNAVRITLYESENLTHPNYAVNYSQSRVSGRSGSGIEQIYFIELKYQGVRYGNAMSLRIVGEDLFNRIQYAIENGGFIMRQNGKLD